MSDRPISAIRALARSWNRLPGGAAGWVWLSLILVATLAVAAIFLMNPRAWRIDHAAALLAPFSYLVGLMTLNLVAHLQGHWRRQARHRLKMQARATGDGTVLTYSLNEIDDPEPPDPAIRAIPATIAIASGMLGFAAAMSLVAVWTSAYPRSPWGSASSLVFILVVLAAASVQIT